jgi:hypothetical protein
MQPKNILQIIQAMNSTLTAEGITADQLEIILFLYIYPFSVIPDHLRDSAGGLIDKGYIKGLKPNSIETVFQLTPKKISIITRLLSTTYKDIYK